MRLYVLLLCTFLRFADVVVSGGIRDLYDRRQDFLQAAEYFETIMKMADLRKKSVGLPFFFCGKKLQKSANMD